MLIWTDALCVFFFVLRCRSPGHAVFRLEEGLGRPSPRQPQVEGLEGLDHLKIRMILQNPTESNTWPWWYMIESIRWLQLSRSHDDTRSQRIGSLYFFTLFWHGLNIPFYSAQWIVLQMIAKQLGMSGFVQETHHFFAQDCGSFPFIPSKLASGNAPRIWPLDINPCHISDIARQSSCQQIPKESSALEI